NRLSARLERCQRKCDFGIAIRTTRSSSKMSDRCGISALGGKADINWCSAHVRFWPKADMAAILSQRSNRVEKSNPEEVARQQSDRFVVCSRFRQLLARAIGSKMLVPSPRKEAACFCQKLRLLGPQH